MFMMLGYCVDCSHENAADCIKRHGRGARVYYVVGRKCMHGKVPRHSYVLVDVFSGELLEVNTHSPLISCPETTRPENICGRYESFVERDGIREQSPSAEELLACVEEMWKMYPWARGRKSFRGENGDYRTVGF